MSEKMKTVNIKGKNYVQVNERVKAFRGNAEWKGWSIVTTVHTLTDDVCVMQATIRNSSDQIIATGWAREVRNDASSMVNKTSYVENCETSAVGRALGFLGIGIDENICSAEELAFALQAQNNTQVVNPTPTAQKTVETPENVIYAKDKELSEREQDEYTAAMADADAAETVEQLKATWERYKAAAFNGKLAQHIIGIKTIKGWK